MKDTTVDENAVVAKNVGEHESSDRLCDGRSVFHLSFRLRERFRSLWIMYLAETCP